MSLTSTNISSLAELLFQKTKTLLLLAVFTVSSLNVFAQTPTKISDHLLKQHFQLKKR